MSTTWQIQQRWHRKTMPDCAAPYDVIVVGGGVNGAGVARDAAGRGARVLLLEAGDIAQGTSSKSTKLIPGELRYLEHYAFGLVREADRKSVVSGKSVTGRVDSGGSRTITKKKNN